MIGPSVGDAKSLRSVKRVNSKNAKILCKHYQMLTYFARISITVQLTYWFIGLDSTKQLNLLVILPQAKLLNPNLSTVQ